MSYILLKFDDLSNSTCASFQKVYDICHEKGVPVCFGLIGKSLYNDPAVDYIDTLIRMKSEGVELWNHGFWHTESEFSETFYNQQLESIRFTQFLMRKYLGDSAITFGSPHNNSTETTIKVLRDEFPEINNYFFMADAGGVSSARQLVMRCNYEIETGVISFGFFHDEYERIKRYPYFVMQGHPSYWREEDFKRFNEILNFLIEEGNGFVTSRELSTIDISGFDHEMFGKWEKDVLDFFTCHDKTVLYGAGEIGREVFRFLQLKGIKPDAFVVSDGHKTFSKICDTPVYCMSEARNCMRKFAIIPTLLGKNHDSIFERKVFEGIPIWKPQNGTYDEFIDFVRYMVSVESCK